MHLEKGGFLRVLQGAFQILYTGSEPLQIFGGNGITHFVTAVDTGFYHKAKSGSW